MDQDRCCSHINEEQLDAALALLVSLFPSESDQRLLAALLDAGGCVHRAHACLTITHSTNSSKRSRSPIRPIPSRKQKTNHSLKSYFSPSLSECPKALTPDPDPFQSHHAFISNASTHLFLVHSSPSRPPLKPSSPIQLDVSNVSHHIPCELFLNFLPEADANDLLRELMAKSSTWNYSSAFILGRRLNSKHRVHFYIDHSNDTWSPMSENDIAVRDRMLQKLGHTPSDSPNNSWSPRIRSAAVTISHKVNEVYNRRGPRSPLEIQGPWRPNVVATNEYVSTKSTVGMHNDRLTHIGPRPIIASLTLGATRAFRVRRLKDPTNTSTSTGSAQTYDVLLPHNSMLIMFPPMQEKYKHGILPIANSVTKPTGILVPHEISGETRINLTFRMWRPEYIDMIPLCDCGRTCQLRPVVKKSQNYGRYFWCCRGNGPPKPSTPQQDGTSSSSSDVHGITYFKEDDDHGTEDDDEGLDYDESKPEADDKGNLLMRVCTFFKWLEPAQPS